MIAEEDCQGLLDAIRLIDSMPGQEAREMHLPELIVVGRWSKDRRYFGTHEAKIDRHLSPVVTPMIEGVLDHLVTRRFHDNLSASEQFPVRH